MAYSLKSPLVHSNLHSMTAAKDWAQEARFSALAKVCSAQQRRGVGFLVLCLAPEAALSYTSWPKRLSVSWPVKSGSRIPSSGPNHILVGDATGIQLLDWNVNN